MNSFEEKLAKFARLVASKFFLQNYQLAQLYILIFLEYSTL